LFGSDKGGGDLLDVLEIVCDGGISLFGSGKFIVETHRLGSCSVGEGLAESILALLNGTVPENLGRRSSEIVVLSEPLECL
jgi:hypothetical protein